MKGLPSRVIRNAAACTCTENKCAWYIMNAHYRPISRVSVLVHYEDLCHSLCILMLASCISLNSQQRDEACSSHHALSAFFLQIWGPSNKLWPMALCQFCPMPDPALVSVIGKSISNLFISAEEQWSGLTITFVAGKIPDFLCEWVENVVTSYLHGCHLDVILEIRVKILVKKIGLSLAWKIWNMQCHASLRHWNLSFNPQAKCKLLTHLYYQFFACTLSAFVSLHCLLSYLWSFSRLLECEVDVFVRHFCPLVNIASACSPYCLHCYRCRFSWCWCKTDCFVLSNWAKNFQLLHYFWLNHIYICQM